MDTILITVYAGGIFIAAICLGIMNNVESLKQYAPKEDAATIMTIFFWPIALPSAIVIFMIMKSFDFGMYIGERIEQKIISHKANHEKENHK